LRASGFPVRSTSKQDVKTDLHHGERQYTAIEQNTEKPSRWGQSWPRIAFRPGATASQSVEGATSTVWLTPSMSVMETRLSARLTHGRSCPNSVLAHIDSPSDLADVVEAEKKETEKSGLSDAATITLHC
jgi:hypothetical protein